MVGVNGGLDVDEGFYNFSIVNDEPIFIFEVETGYDIVSTFSQVKKDYNIVEVGSSIPSGYLFKKCITTNDIRDMLGVSEKCLIRYRDVNHYDVYNYDLIQKYGWDGESALKARKWLRDELIKNTPKERTKWIVENRPPTREEISQKYNN